ncbi:MAG TPA: CoA pyrophosphatase [Bryobacteraceae bacterium]|nr:CoA pyrophosphatase [Bryobacteraceae bacterium]
MPDAEAAVAIVCARRPSESVLLMRRAERDGDPWSGHWSLPGGRRDPTDRDLLHTALRELQEECGVRLAPGLLAAMLPVRPARRKGGGALPVTPFLFRVESELPATPDGREAVETAWAPLGLLRNPASHRLLPVPGYPPTLLFPAVPLGPVPLWGFTHRLLCDWLELSPPRAQAERLARNAARETLDFLLDRGLTLLQDWRPGSSAGRPTKVASVGGGLPVLEVLERLSRPAGFVLALQRVEVSTTQVQLTGFYEDYRIAADTSAVRQVP